MSKTNRTDAARDIEKEGVRKTDRATPDPNKGPEEKFEEMGEREEIRRRAGRDHD